MNDRPNVTFFRGASGTTGLHTLHQTLLDPAQAQGIYILKGGPGCGKTALLGQVAQRAEQEGEPVEYLACSGDPEQLDGLLLPRRGIALVDGSPPHVVEPTCPGAVEHYVNLSTAYDTRALEEKRGGILALLPEIQGANHRASRCFSAWAQMGEDATKTLATQGFLEKVERRTKGILSREVKGRGRSGRVALRYLSAVTGQGYLCRYDTAQALCSRIYCLWDGYGLGHLMLNRLLKGLLDAGEEVIACPQPLRPYRLAHLLVPRLSLAFVTSPAEHPYEGAAYRNIRLDAMVEGEVLSRHKTRLKFSRKMAGLLEEEGVKALKERKILADQMESLYRPWVDETRLKTLADQVIAQIFP